jgi:RHS repeat-associated protein
MLTNGDWTYTWNAENRLIQAVNGTTTLEFKYDYMGRRVEKKVTENSTLTKHEYFVYDGYKLIEKLDVLNGSVASQKFIWSGETLLSMNDANGTYYYLIDANKNVGQLLDSSGTIVAKYEYSPFGKLTSVTDTVNNPFRFSSEYWDTETGLVYYNFRYYSPELGRWVSRDPIEEDGGWNLYGMLGNRVVNSIDSKGLITCCGNKEYDPSSSCCKNNKIVPVQKAKCSYLRAAINALRNILKSTQQTLNDINDIIYNQSLANASGDFIRDSGFWAYSVASAGQGAVAMQAGKAGLKQLANVYGKLRGFGDIAAGYSAGMSLDVFKQRPFVASKENQALKRRAEKQTAEALAKIQKYRQVLSNTCCK